MSAPKTKKPLTKTAFVLGLPKDMAAKTIVEKAKAVGLTISEGYVYEIRSAAKRVKKKAGAKAPAKPAGKAAAKAAPAKPEAPKPAAAAKGAPAKVEPAKLSKAAFIRSLGDTPAKQVVILGKKRGLSFTETYVYNVRGSGKSKKAPKLASVAPSAAKAGGSDESTFRRLVLELGAARARALLADVERRLADLVAGR